MGNKFIAYLVLVSILSVFMFENTWFLCVSSW